MVAYVEQGAAIFLLHIQVDERILHEPTEQIFEREIADSLWELFKLMLVGVVETFNEPVFDGVGGGLVALRRSEIKTCAGEGVLNMVDDASLDRPGVSPDIRRHEFPDLLILRKILLAGLSVHYELRS